MKKELLIKILLIIIYYIGFYFVFIYENVKYPVFDMNFSIYNLFEIIFLALPLSILFIPFSKRKKLLIILSITFVIVTYFPMGVIFGVHDCYKSYTADTKNYLNFDHESNISNDLFDIFPKEIAENDEYYYFYNHSLFAAVPDYLVMLKQDTTNTNLITKQFDDNGYEKKEYENMQYYVISDDYKWPFKKLYVGVISNTKVIYFYTTHEIFEHEFSVFNQRIMEVMYSFEKMNFHKVLHFFDFIEENN